MRSGSRRKRRRLASRIGGVKPCLYSGPSGAGSSGSLTIIICKPVPFQINKGCKVTMKQKLALQAALPHKKLALFKVWGRGMRPVLNKKRRKNRVQTPAQHLLPWSEHCRHKSCKIPLHKEDPAMLQGSYHFLSQIHLFVHPLHTIKKRKENNTRYVISILNSCCCCCCTPPSTHVVRNVKTLLRVLKR